MQTTNSVCLLWWQLQTLPLTARWCFTVSSCDAYCSADSTVTDNHAENTANKRAERCLYDFFYPHLLRLFRQLKCWFLHGILFQWIPDSMCYRSGSCSIIRSSVMTKQQHHGPCGEETVNGDDNERLQNGKSCMWIKHKGTSGNV